MFLDPQDVRMEYDVAGNVIYKGEHAYEGTATTDPHWRIEKYTWDGANITRIQTREGAWDNRTILPWGA